MSKGKLGRVIFRKIGGRIIPIKISNVADKIAQASDMGGSRFRKIIASSEKHGFMGQLTLRVPPKGNSAELVDVRVREEFRRRGISKNLFARATDFLKRAGYKFLRSNDIQHPAQIKIRKAFGKSYSAGGKRKAGSRFFADQFGYYGEETRRVMSKDAIEILKNNSRGRQISATTMIKRVKRGK